MHYSTQLKAAGAEFFPFFKLAYHTGEPPFPDPILNLFSLCVTTLPKVTIAHQVMNRFAAAKGWAQTPMSTLAIPKTTWAVSYWAVGLSLLVMGASVVENKENPWSNRNVTKLLDALGIVSDGISVVAAVGLLSVGQVFAGTMIIGLVALQLAERYHYISPKTSFIAGCAGYFSGIIAAQALAQKAFYLGLGLAHVGMWLYGTRQDTNAVQCTEATKKQASHEEHWKRIFDRYLQDILFLGVHHPQITKDQYTMAVCAYNQGQYDWARSLFLEIKERSEAEGASKNQIDGYSAYMAFCLISEGVAALHESKYPEAKPLLIQARDELGKIADYNVEKGGIEYYLGRIHMEQKEYPLAQSNYSKAINYFKVDGTINSWSQSRHEHFYWAYIALAKAFWLQKEYSQGLEICEKAENFPELAQTSEQQVNMRLVKALCYLGLKEKVKAEESYNLAFQVAHYGSVSESRSIFVMFEFLKEIESKDKSRYEELQKRAQTCKSNWRTSEKDHLMDGVLKQLGEKIAEL
ncbi:MAG: hypothetical protein JSR58_05680 [Verrucomicrobia bacterium]|nr:hypothetical protein [Verrucomicrobiota bacterium]